MNRLANETSPYLQQHASNPVDWYPWGAEALDRARQEGMPIFLSVGYSACHWCHVMERESFENELIAAFLNEHFVCIKVDREERPDIDNLYMEAVQVMTGQGGWPMSVFLTPRLEPFFAGTYFPPEDRWGRPGFFSLLQQLVTVWDEDQDKVARVCAQVTERLAAMAETAPGGTLNLLPLDRLFDYYVGEFDEQHGGFGDAPKFPPSMALRCLLHLAVAKERPDEQRNTALDMVEQTLVYMASGGMYDQIGGGFHRYSTDAQWLVPHFEKMLYDNALLLLAYTEAFQLTGRAFYARVVRETVEYVLREMVAAHGAFFSTQDADSEGEEGKFFVWTPAQVAAVLGEEDGEVAKHYWNIAAGGNFEGRSIPHRLHAIASDWTEGFAALPDSVALLRERLLAARARRVAPATDEKVLAAWNGLMISALARAGAVFGEPRWIEAATSAARFILAEMRAEQGGVYRTFKDGRARFPGYLDDHANLAAGLFDLFEATSELRWLDESEALADFFVREFWDPDGAAFFFAAGHHTDLLVRQKESYDSATPASNSIAVMTLLRLSVATGRTDLRDIADACLRSYYRQLLRAPQSLTEMMQALDFHLAGAEEVVCSTPADATSLAAAAWREYRARGIIFDVQGADYATRVPVARGRGPINHAPTVYLCREGACELPRNEI